MRKELSDRVEEMVRDEGTEPAAGWPIAVGLGLVAVAALVGWVLFAGAGEVAEPQEEAGDGAFVAFDKSSPSADKPNRQAAPSPKDAAEISRPERKRTIVRGKLPDASSEAGETTDAGLAAAKDAAQWQDPTNKRVLGAKKWMAVMPKAQKEAIEEELDRERPQRYPYDLKVRRAGIDVAKDIVRGCFSRLKQRTPQAEGRVIVSFDLAADGSQARFRNVDIPANLKLDDAEFEDCIFRKLERASFATGEQGVMRVKYPFFFDGK